MEFTTLTRTAGQVLAGCALGGALVVTAALAILGLDYAMTAIMFDEV